MLGTLGLSEALARALAFDLGLDPDAPAGSLTRDTRKSLSSALGAFRVPVDAIGNFSLAMLTAGGLRLDDVHSKTMESRLVPGLSFAGEILDVDGDTGGYNLQAAFATGLLAGRSARARMSVGPS
jgi:predicted flavoprotein YhiN